MRYSRAFGANSGRFLRPLFPISTARQAINNLVNPEGTSNNLPESAQLRVHLLELGVLALQFLQLLLLRGVHAAVSRLPLVVRRLGDAVLVARLAELRTQFNLLAQRDYLLLAVFQLLLR